MARLRLELRPRRGHTRPRPIAPDQPGPVTAVARPTRAAAVTTVSPATPASLDHLLPTRNSRTTVGSCRATDCQWRCVASLPGPRTPGRPPLRENAPMTYVRGHRRRDGTYVRPHHRRPRQFGGAGLPRPRRRPRADPPDPLGTLSRARRWRSPSPAPWGTPGPPPHEEERAVRVRAHLRNGRPVRSHLRRTGTPVRTAGGLGAAGLFLGLLLIIGLGGSGTAGPPRPPHRQHRQVLPLRTARPATRRPTHPRRSRLDDPRTDRSGPTPPFSRSRGGPGAPAGGVRSP